MSIDVQTFLGPQSADHFVTPTMATMKGSAILGIAAQVRELMAQGREICNLTVGDFRPNYFPIPESLAADVKQAYNDGETNYPPSDGIPKLVKPPSQNCIKLVWASITDQVLFVWLLVHGRHCMRFGGSLSAQRTEALVYRRGTTAITHT